MEMSACYLAILAGLAAILGATGNVLDREESILADNPRLYSLGIVDGKAYIMDNSTTYTWTEAKAYCTTQGMKPASIRNVAQHNFLVSKFNILGYQQMYWTGGRNKRTVDASEWDGESGSVINFDGVYSVAPAPILIGVSFYSYIPLGSVVALHPITNKYYVLCQIS